MPHLRANWVALRTVHRRIDAVVGQIAGVDIYSVDGVQVVLLPKARHFRRVVPCERCRKPVIERGRPIRRWSKLLRELNVVCRQCSQLPESPGSRDLPESLRNLRDHPRGDALTD